MPGVNGHDMQQHTMNYLFNLPAMDNREAFHAKSFDLILFAIG